MDKRERLIELIQKVQDHGTKGFSGHDEKYGKYVEVVQTSNEELADYLLANGTDVELPKHSVSLIDGHIEE